MLVTHHQARLNRQLRIPPPSGQYLQRLSNIRPNHRDIPCKLPDGNQEVAKQNEQPVQLDQEARQRPAEEDQQDARGEGGGAFEFLAA